MDNNCWRPAPGGGGGGGEPTMDAGDWRSQLQPDSRQRIVNRMVPPPHIQSKQQSQQSQSQITQVHPMQENQMNPQLQSMNLQVSSVATMQQNNVATLQHNSLSSSSGVPTTSQSMIGPLQSGSTIDSASLDSTAQRGNTNSGDWQEEIYQKIEVMKEAYLPELTEMYDKCAGKLQQQPKHEQFEKLKIFTTMLERVLQFLQVPKSNILPNFKENLPSYEKQIVNFLNLNWPRKPGLSLQQGQPIPPPHIQSMQRSQQSQSQITQVHPMHENQMNPHLQSMNLQGSSVATMQQNKVATLQHNSLSSLSGVPTTSQSMISTLQPGSTIDSASLDSTAQRGNANSGDWQEEIYQKIEVMKEAYLPELTEMYHKIVGKLQQQPKHEQFEKLEIFKAMLERILQFLQVPKSNILPNFKEKLPAYEKQIVNFLNSNKPRKPGPSLQQGQQIPPPPKKRRLS